MAHGTKSSRITLIAMALVPEAPPFTEDSMETSEAYIISVDEGGASYIYMDNPYVDNGTEQYDIRYVANSGEIEYWNHTVQPENENFTSGLVQLSWTADGIIICEGTQWVLLDAEDGSVLDDHGIDCHVGLRYEFITDAMDETCDGKDVEDGAIFQDWRILNNRLEPIQWYNDDDDSNFLRQDCEGWARNIPYAFDAQNVLLTQDVGTEHFLIVSEQWAAMIKYPTSSGPPEAVVEDTWNLSLIHI